MAKEIGISATTIERSERFAKGLDAAEEVSPGIREAVLTGEVKAPKNLISEIRNVPEEHRPAYNNNLTAKEFETLSRKRK